MLGGVVFSRLSVVYNYRWRHPISSQSSCVSLVKIAHLRTHVPRVSQMYKYTHIRAWQGLKMHTTTCCFCMSTLCRDLGGRRGGMGDLKCARGKWGLLRRLQRQGWSWRCCGNLAQSCVPGMTSLGGRVEARCLGIATAARDWREE